MSELGGGKIPHFIIFELGLGDLTLQVRRARSEGGTSCGHEYMAAAGAYSQDGQRKGLIPDASALSCLQISRNDILSRSLFQVLSLRRPSLAFRILLFA